ncbi:MAG: hypoxanthine phosphoribosyltransferase [Spirochaetota bacterium]
MEKLKVLITKDQIQKKVKELAESLSRDYSENDYIILICNLKGAFIFLADLCRKITVPICIDFIATSSYDGTESTEYVRIIKDLKMNIMGKDIIIVEDIVDTGYTLSYIIEYLKLHHPKSIKVCTLLDKKCRRKVEIPIDYTGFVIDNKFVVGYGLDYNERYRELEYIAELSK